MTSQRRRSARPGQLQRGAPPRSVPRWRRRLNSFGGPVVVGTLALAIAGIALLAIRARPATVSDAALLGDPVTLAAATHISDPRQLVIPQGQPPAGGPHFLQPQPPGIYDEPVADGNAIHSLEHGMVWISYRPDLLDRGKLDALTTVANAYGNDVVLAPRPANSAPVSLVSWGRRLNIDSPLDETKLRAFVETNRNRSPEPGVR